MRDLVESVLTSDEKIDLARFLDRLIQQGKQYFLRNEILQHFSSYCREAEKAAHFYYASYLGKLLHYTHELILEEGAVWLLVRSTINDQQIWQISTDLNRYGRMSPHDLLEVRDRLVNRSQSSILEINVHPFYNMAYTVEDPRNIGQGLAFLNHYLCNQVSIDRTRWLDVLFQVLCGHEYDGLSLLINEQIGSGEDLYKQVQQALWFIRQRPGDEPWEQLHYYLEKLGFAPGWGDRVSRVEETLELLQYLMDSPAPPILEAFLARIPIVFRAVLVSIHGWVGQSGVMGRSETMSQVSYVLEQARQLEHELQVELNRSGLDRLGIRPQVVILTRLIPHCEETLCYLPLEKLAETMNGWILRVPFRECNPNVTDNWISKFEIWPYLENFAIDAEKVLLSQLGGRPQLIVGHYSDGNLVAYLLARRFKAIHCQVAHALEKPKYLFSDLYWQDWEAQYHFSAQFTADLITMNAANFIITSSYQEIVGTPESVGQYESYKCFTMPQLYHVVNGIELCSPKFNRVPPGVNENIFFPYTRKDSRDPHLCQRIDHLLFHHTDDHILGHLDQPEKKPLLTIAPISSIKNLTGLVECFGRSLDLQNHCNLILITSKLHPSEASHAEEETEITQLHDLIDRYQLHGRVRWLGLPLPHTDLGEIYRVVADQRGFFVHFARFEAFGQTILEAMISGLPAFATQFGGCLEIIKDGDNGFHINPTDPEGTVKKILAFIHACVADPTYWQGISERAIERVQQQYNWPSHIRQLLLLTKIYGFWNCMAQQQREALLNYMDTLYHLIYKPRAAEILAQHLYR